MIPIGLDSYWELPDDRDEPEFERDLNLTGGMMSGHGQGSFRGKVYNVFVKHFTGISLYRDLDNGDVTAIADTLEDLTWDDLESVDVDPDIVERGNVPSSFHGGYHGFSDSDEFEDFKRMFRKYADAGASLIAWY